MTIIILADFTAYPNDEARAFVAGQTVSDLKDEDASLYVAKGLATKVDDEALRTENRRTKG